MTYTIQLVCSEQGRPRKIVEVHEENLAKNEGPVDSMNDAFLTKNNPFRVSSPKIRPQPIKRKIVMNGIIEFHLL